ncbi:MAG: methenyltetrahydromethanopterin cyclohydrolase [Halobacteriaceae archaeon]
MESLNRMALELADEALDFAAELDVGAFELDNGATVLDFGVDHDGGIEAGLLLAELQTAGLATVQTRVDEVGGATIPHVELATDHPGLALLGAQKAGWELAVGDFEGLGSGPARALVAEEPEYMALDYADAFEFAVLAVESETLPDEGVADRVAERAGVAPEQVYLVAFPTASVVGSVAMAARAAEAAAFRLFELDYDPQSLVSASASAPVAPVAADEGEAIARTNDALAYGGRAHLTVKDDFDAFDEVASTAAETHGVPFADLFAEADWDFGEVAPDVFGPAAVTIDVLGGPTYAFGETHESLVAESFGL